MEAGNVAGKSSPLEDDGEFKVHAVGAREVADPIEAVLIREGDEFLYAAHGAGKSGDFAESVVGHVDVEGGAEGVVGESFPAAADEARYEAAAPGLDEVEEPGIFPALPEGLQLLCSAFVEPDAAVAGCARDPDELGKDDGVSSGRKLGFAGSGVR